MSKLTSAKPSEFIQEEEEEEEEEEEVEEEEGSAKFVQFLSTA